MKKEKREKREKKKKKNTFNSTDHKHAQELSYSSPGFVPDLAWINHNSYEVPN